MRARLCGENTEEYGCVGSVGRQLEKEVRDFCMTCSPSKTKLGLIQPCGGKALLHHYLRIPTSNSVDLNIGCEDSKKGTV